MPFNLLSAFRKRSPEDTCLHLSRTPPPRRTGAPKTFGQPCVCIHIALRVKRPKEAYGSSLERASQWTRASAEISSGRVISATTKKSPRASGPEGRPRPLRRNFRPGWVPGGILRRAEPSGVGHRRLRCRARLSKRGVPSRRASRCPRRDSPDAGRSEPEERDRRQGPHGCRLRPARQVGCAGRRARPWES